MPLLEILFFNVGAAITKALILHKLKGAEYLTESVADIIDVISSQSANAVERERGKDIFQRIGRETAASLEEIFIIEGQGIEEGELTSIAIAVGEQIDQLSPRALTEHDLDPGLLTEHLLKSYKKVTRHFSAAGASLYQRVLQEVAYRIIAVAPLIPVACPQTQCQSL